MYKINKDRIHISPTQDLTFKILFGITENKKILISFLNSILNRKGNDRIYDLMYFDKEIIRKQNLKRFLEDDDKSKVGRKSKKLKPEDFNKTGYMDILVKATSGENIETTSKDSNDIAITNDTASTSNDNTVDITSTNYNENSENEIDDEIMDDDSNDDSIDDKINDLILQFDQLLELFNEDISRVFNGKKEYYNIINNNTIKNIKKFKDRIQDLFKTDENENNLRISARTLGEDIINIEIQMYEEPQMAKRSLYYAVNILSRSLVPGDSYGKVPNLIMINILNFNLFKKNEKELSKLDWVFTLMDKRTKGEYIYEDVLNIHFIELPKFKAYEENHINEMRKKYPWILFLNNPNDDFFNEKETIVEVDEAKKILKKLQGNSEFSSLYESLNKSRIDYLAKISGYKEETIRVKEINKILEENNKKVLEENKRHKEEKKRVLEENKRHIEEKIKVLEENKKVLEENKRHIEENKRHIEEKKILTKENEILREEIRKNEKYLELKHLLRSLIKNEPLKEIENDFKALTWNELKEIEKFVRDPKYKIIDLANYLKLDKNKISELCKDKNIPKEEL